MDTDHVICVTLPVMDVTRPRQAGPGPPSNQPRSRSADMKQERIAARGASPYPVRRPGCCQARAARSATQKSRRECVNHRESRAALAGPVACLVLVLDANGIGAHTLSVPARCHFAITVTSPGPCRQGPRSCLPGHLRRRSAALDRDVCDPSTDVPHRLGLARLLTASPCQADCPDRIRPGRCAVSLTMPAVEIVTPR